MSFRSKRGSVIAITVSAVIFFVHLFILVGGEYYYDEENSDLEFDYYDKDPDTTNFIDEDEFFKKYYPPKDENGVLIDEAAWKKIKDDADKRYAELLKLKPTRPAPYCVAETDPNLDRKFVDNAVLKKVFNAKTGAIKDIPGMSDKTGKFPPIEKIQFYDILSPDRANNGIGRLNQWMHIVVTSSVALEGLYIQAISAPLGIPFGNFRNDFECKNGATGKVKAIGSKTIPCTYRPRVSIRHPSVYTYSGEKTNVFRTHFEWEDVHCSYAPKMQFFVVAVQDFKDPAKITRFFTPSYEHGVDSPDGVPYPFYLGWKDQMKCDSEIIILDTTSDPSPKKLTFHTTRSKHNILVNFAFDQCMQHKPTKPVDKTCPPGPYKCFDASSSNVKTKSELEQRFQTILNETSFTKDCFDPVFCLDPKHTEPVVRYSTTTPEPAPEPLKPNKLLVLLLGDEGGGPRSSFLRNLIQIQRNSAATHGHIMILGFMMLMGVGTFWARYFKETGGLNSNGTNGCLGMGQWLWAHIIVFFIALGLVWIGLLEVLHLRGRGGSLPCEHYDNWFKISDSLDVNPNMLQGPGEDDFGTKDMKEMSKSLGQLCRARESSMKIHSAIGYIAALSLHISFVTGWYRPPRTVSRKIIVSTHILTGYIAQFSAVISVANLVIGGRMCADILVLVILHWLTTVILYICGVFVQRAEDKLRDIEGRKMLSNEGIEVPQEKNKFSKIKYIILLVSGVVHILLYLGVFVIYIFMYDLTDLSKVYTDTLPCLIAECKLPSWKVDTYILTYLLDQVYSASNATNA